MKVSESTNLIFNECSNSYIIVCLIQFSFYKQYFDSSECNINVLIQTIVIIIFIIQWNFLSWKNAFNTRQLNKNISPYDKNREVVSKELVGHNGPLFFIPHLMPSRRKQCCAPGQQVGHCDSNHITLRVYLGLF